MKEEVKPVLFVKCSHNDELIEIMDDYFVEKMFVDDLRTIVAKKAGIPVSIFKLVSRRNVELFDKHVLFDYQIECGDTVYMEIWDGWDDFINDCIRGKTKMVRKSLADDEVQARFQMKVAMYIGAHFGRIDLVNWCIKCDLRPDEPIGEHPARQWCLEQSHLEIYRSPVHEAAEFGHLQILNNFYDENKNNTWLMARDGNDLTPLNLALRNHQRACASFLLTKQWARVKVANKTMSLQLVRRVSMWCDRCKERTYMKFGPNKSSLKRRTFTTGPLVTHGVIIDGYPKSENNDHAKPKLRPFMRPPPKQPLEEIRYTDDINSFDPRLYFRHISAVHAGAAVKRRQNSGDGTQKTNENKAGHKASDCSDAPNDSHRDTANGSEAETQQHKTNGNGRVASSRRSSRQTIIGQQKMLTRARNARPRTAFVPGVAKGSLHSHPGRVDNVRDKVTPIPGLNGRRGTRVASAMPALGRRRRRDVREDDEALPQGTAEYNLRPFFYYNGSRASETVSPTLDAIEQYYDITAKERAKKSLDIATTFKDKSWLMRVQMAMSLSPSSFKREVSNLEHSFGPSKYYKRRMSRSANVNTRSQLDTKRQTSALGPGDVTFREDVIQFGGDIKDNVDDDEDADGINEPANGTPPNDDGVADDYETNYLNYEELD